MIGGPGADDPGAIRVQLLQHSVVCDRGFGSRRSRRNLGPGSVTFCVTAPDVTVNSDTVLTATVQASPSTPPGVTSALITSRDGGTGGCATCMHVDAASSITRYRKLYKTLQGTVATSTIKLAPYTGDVLTNS